VGREASGMNAMRLGITETDMVTEFMKTSQAQAMI
jgi:hypothetical protein